MTYNLTNITQANQTTILTFTQGVNNVLMHGMLGVLILIGLWAVVFISVMVSSNDAVKASLTSGFVAFALAISLFALGLVPQLAIFIPILVVGMTLALSWGK